jgi:hypothetical protein
VRSEDQIGDALDAPTDGGQQLIERLRAPIAERVDQSLAQS